MLPSEKEMLLVNESLIANIADGLSSPTFPAYRTAA